jgi:Na+-driven multidrug efflux pump
MITANSVAGNIMPLGMLFTGAMAGGACVVIGKSVGTGNYDKTIEYSRTIQILFAGLGIFSSMVIFLTRHLTTALFTGLSAEAISLASTFIAIGALTMIGTTYHASCFIGINRGSGDGRFVVMI